MNTKQLLTAMEVIAQNVITSPTYITDFTVHDTKDIEQNDAKIPFVWIVREGGTWIHFIRQGTDWQEKMMVHVEHAWSSSNNYMFFIYDGTEFYPVFEHRLFDVIATKISL